MNLLKLDRYFLWTCIFIVSGIPIITDLNLDTWRTLLTLFILSYSLFRFGVYVKTSLNINLNNNKDMIVKNIFKFYKNNFIYLYITLFLLIVVFEIIKSSILYKYSLYESFYSIREYIWLLAVIPFYRVFKSSDNCNKDLEHIINILLLSLVLRLIIWLFYTLFNVVVFQDLLFEFGKGWTRAGLIRMDATPLVGFITPTLYYLYLNNKRIKYLIEIGFVFFYLIMINQTRMIIIISLFTLVLMILIYQYSIHKNLFSKLKINKKKVFYSFLAILSILIIAVSAYLKTNKFSFNDSSLNYRLYEFSYYSSLLNKNNWFDGLGILTERSAISRDLLFGNISTKMYLDDLGFFQFFLQFGVFSLVLYILYCGYIIKIINLVKISDKNNIYIYFIGLFTYLVLIAIPLNVFGIQRIFYIILLLALAGSIQYKLQNTIEC